MPRGIRYAQTLHPGETGRPWWSRSAHLPRRGEDYAYARPSLTAQELRRLELRAGAEPRQGRRNGVHRYSNAEQRRLETRVAVQAEAAYRRLVKDRAGGRRAKKSTAKKKVTPRRSSGKG